MITYLKSWLFPSETQTSEMSYPKRPNRYLSLGWNQNHQDCYTQADINLLRAISEKYQLIADTKGEKNPFELITEKQFYDWWICHKPSIDLSLDKKSFTISNREVKSQSAFPLWNFADMLAKEIANWQGERRKDQNPQLMNDPVMLIFQELKIWALEKLAEKGCNPESLLEIGKRQNFLKDLAHIIPEFGPDGIHLLDVQTRLDEANNIVSNCIANKQLPELLNDGINKLKSLENTVGSYLHFLLIDEPVADNFAYDFSNNFVSNCDASPVCKAYQNVGTSAPAQDAAVAAYQSVNRFYDVSKVSDTVGNNQFHINLKQSALDHIKFADFVTPKDKDNYLKTLAIFESLIQVRLILQNYKKTQESIGNYIFAKEYLDITNKLTSNSLHLIDEAQNRLLELLSSAHAAQRFSLKGQFKNQYVQFKNNLRSLETQFSQGFTPKQQLENFCIAAKSSMQAYQLEMTKLSKDMQSGKALHEVRIAMEKLERDISNLNSFVHAQLNNEQLALPHPEDKSIHRTTALDAGIAEAEANAATIAPIAEKTSSDPIQDFLHEVAGKSNYIVKGDLEPLTNNKIFTYKVYQVGNEIGEIKLYHVPWLCFSEDKQIHNVLDKNGIFTTLNLESYKETAPTCEILPFSENMRLVISSMGSAAHGFLRGTSTLVDQAMQKNHSPTTATITSKAVYYLPVFLFNWYMSQQSKEEDVSLESMWSSLCEATYATGNLFIMNTCLASLTKGFNFLSEKLNAHNWKKLSKGAAAGGAVLQFSIFAATAKSEGPKAAALALAAGASAQIATEYTGQHLLNKFM